jgi:hypothetical protein
MMAYDGPGGALFKNSRKERDTHPDLQGNIELSQEAVQSVIEQANRGVKYPKLDLSGWSKVSSKGNKFISLSAKKPWEKSGGYSQGEWIERWIQSGPTTAATTSMMRFHSNE